MVNRSTSSWKSVSLVLLVSLLLMSLGCSKGNRYAPLDADEKIQATRTEAKLLSSEGLNSDSERGQMRLRRMRHDAARLERILEENKKNKKKGEAANKK